MGINKMKQSELHRAIFLDRDGVINRTVLCSGRPYPPASLSDVEILPGVQSGLEVLKALGYLLIIVTNQPDVARGNQTRENVEAIHHYLQNTLPITRFMVCYHDDQDNCTCRNPLLGC
jgi:D-glycero-D-manno-heptose 1,7-bisphosphate phosphatase